MKTQHIEKGKVIPNDQNNPISAIMNFLGLGNILANINVTEIKEHGSCVSQCPAEQLKTHRDFIEVSRVCDTTIENIEEAHSTHDKSVQKDIKSLS